MSFELFLKVSRWVHTSKCQPYDFADTLHFPYTTIVLVAFVCLMWLKQYVHKPLQCWVPQEFNHAWEEYAEYYCWISGTYFHDPQKDLLSLSPEERMKGHIGYYQWAPYFMLVQALLFWVPCVIWKIIAGTTSMPVASLLHVACSAAYADTEHREKAIVYISRCVLDVLSRRSRRLASGKRGTQNNARCGTNSGSYITIMYFILKLLLIFHAGLELYLIIIFTNANGAFYGFEVIRDLLEGHQWQETGAFPYVSWCDFEVRAVGNVHRQSLMCVLPHNMLYEKIFLFLWWWLAFIAFLELVSIVLWIKRLAFRHQRRTFIRRFLQYTEAIGHDRDKRMCKSFISTFLQVDGVFLLHLLADKAGDTFAAHIVEKMWKVYTKKDDERRAVMQGMKMNEFSEGHKPQGDMVV